MKPHKLRYIIAFMLGYVLLSTLIAYLDNDGLSLWLGLNVFLACIPICLIVLLERVFNLNQYKYSIDGILIFIGFVFFFPNTFYIITDMIHLDFNDFYYQVWYSDTVYLENIQAYLLLIHILFSVLVGIYAAIFSLAKLHAIMKQLKYHMILHNSIIVGLLFLSSIGIYIGRFLRLFSWDILNPGYVITNFMNHFSGFTILFVLLFTVTQIIIYYGYRFLFEEELF